MSALIPQPARLQLMLSVGLLGNTACRLGLAMRSEPAGDTLAGTGNPNDYLADVTPPVRAAGGVTPREALGLDAVYRAVFVLETAVDQLTFDAWRGPKRLDPAPSWLRTPDVDDHLTGFLGDTVACLATRGNAYWLNSFGPDGRCINSRVLHPFEVWPFRNNRGEKRLRYRGKEYTTREISHLRLLRVPGEMLGLGPIQAAQIGLRGALDVTGYAGNWFQTSGVPTGVLSTEQRLTPEEAAEWKAAWHKSVTPGSTAVLGSGLGYRPLYLTPREVQWLDVQRHGVTGIARLFGIPARHMLASVEGTPLTYANMSQDDLSFARYTLMRYVREIETAATQLQPRGVSARLNLDAFLRPDTLTRYQAHQVGITAGFLLPEEAREIEGLPPLGADLPKPAPTPAPEEIPSNA